MVLDEFRCVKKKNYVKKNHRTRIKFYFYLNQNDLKWLFTFITDFLLIAKLTRKLNIKTIDFWFNECMLLEAVCMQELTKHTKHQVI